MHKDVKLRVEREWPYTVMCGSRQISVNVRELVDDTVPPRRPGKRPHKNSNHQHGSVRRVDWYIDELCTHNSRDADSTHLLLNVGRFGCYMCHLGHSPGYRSGAPLNRSMSQYRYLLYNDSLQKLFFTSNHSLHLSLALCMKDSRAY